jgi:diaminohydroxyphosphoribosylaminopyrimidine deaminase/5-amino-6-(5-phosphoribosylamino)uracil reductase
MARHFTDKDIHYMRRALDLAARARSLTSPNPLVGAVLVKHGTIIGEGFHERAGRPHAEIAALHSATEDPAGATLYINLEPCCHYGRTPPCTDALIRARLRRIVAAMKDPNPLVRGKGFAQLSRAGIRVNVGLLRAEAERLNAPFLYVHRFGRPFITLKWAMTLDGRTSAASGESQWITGVQSRRYAHELRSQVDAVLVGIGTVLQDDPRLTVRLARYRGKQPTRIILDSTLRIPLAAHCLRNSRAQTTIIATTRRASNEKIRSLRSLGSTVLLCRETKGGISLPDLMHKLAEMSIQSLLVEGGRTVAGSFFREGLVDRVVAFISPTILGGSRLTSPVTLWEAPAARAALGAMRLRDVSIKRFDDDVCIEGSLARPRKR